MLEMTVVCVVPLMKYVCRYIFGKIRPSPPSSSNTSQISNYDCLFMPATIRIYHYQNVMNGLKGEMLILSIVAEMQILD